MADSFPTSTHIAANLLQTGYKYRKPLGYYLAGTAAYKTGKYIYDSMAPYSTFFSRKRKRRSSTGVSVYKRPRSSRKSYKQNNGKGVTSQYNRSQQYRYKRMPKYKKKKYTRMVKSINHVINKSLGTQSVVFNDSGSYSTLDAVGQINGTFLMYGSNGVEDTQNVGSKDLWRIINNIDNTANNQFKIRCETAILDLTLTNLSTGPEGANLKLEVDVFEVYFYQETSLSNFGGVITQAQANTSNIQTGIGLNIVLRGTTLFELPAVGQICRYKIMKKTKYFINRNDCITYQMRDAKNYEVDRVDVADGGFVKEKMTKGLFVVHKLIPNDDNETVRGKLGYGCTRAYHYVVNEKNTTNDNWNP